MGAIAVLRVTHEFLDSRGASCGVVGDLKLRTAGHLTSVQHGVPLAVELGAGGS